MSLPQGQSQRIVTDSGALFKGKMCLRGFSGYSGSKTADSAVSAKNGRCSDRTWLLGRASL
jgi:hypothetical protein